MFKGTNNMFLFFKNFFNSFGTVQTNSDSVDTKNKVPSIIPYVKQREAGEGRGAILPWMPQTTYQFHANYAKITTIMSMSILCLTGSRGAVFEFSTDV